MHLQERNKTNGRVENKIWILWNIIKTERASASIYLLHTQIAHGKRARSPASQNNVCYYLAAQILI